LDTDLFLQKGLMMAQWRRNMLCVFNNKLDVSD